MKYAICKNFHFTRYKIKLIHNLWGNYRVDIMPETSSSVQCCTDVYWCKQKNKIFKKRQRSQSSNKEIKTYFMN